jgi:hypothetical protein
MLILAGQYMISEINTGDTMMNRWILVPESRATIGSRESGYLIKKISSNKVSIATTKNCRVLRNRKVYPGTYLHALVEVPRSL